jgi:hypothetical protein
LVALDGLDVVELELPLGDDVVADESEELDAGGDAGGVVVVVVDDWLRVVVSGDAEGEGAGVTRSRSVTRSLLSVQPAITPAPSARTQNPVSNFFIVPTSSWIRIQGGRVQWGCRRRARWGTLNALARARHT